MINYVELIKNLIMPLVIHEDCVKVTSEVLEDGTINVNVNVANEDVGRVIGKGGKIATINFPFWFLTLFICTSVCGLVSIYKASLKDGEKQGLSPITFTSPLIP